MRGTPPQSSERTTSDVTVIHGRSGPPDLRTCVPAGHCLSRARLRHLRESEWIVVIEDSIPVDLAAYKRADSGVRVVHELLLDRTLARRRGLRATRSTHTRCCVLTTIPCQLKPQLARLSSEPPCAASIRVARAPTR